MTQTKKKNKLLAFCGLIMAGITALTCGILSSRNTFASDSGIESFSMPQMYGTIEKDVKVGDTVAGKFYRVYATEDSYSDEDGQCQAGLLFGSELYFNINISDSAYVVDNVTSDTIELLPSIRIIESEIMEIYIPANKTWTTSTGSFLSNDLTIEETTIQNCEIKELVLPDTSNMTEKEYSNGAIVGKWFRVKTTENEFSITFSENGTDNGYGIMNNTNATVTLFSSYMEAKSGEKCLYKYNKTENSFDIYIDEIKIDNLAEGTNYTINENTTFGTLENCEIFELVEGVEEDKNDKFDLNEWLNNTGDNISSWFNGLTGVSIGGSVSLVIVVAIIVAVLRRKKR